MKLCCIKNDIHNNVLSGIKNELNALHLETRSNKCPIIMSTNEQSQLKDSFFSQQSHTSK